MGLSEAKMANEITAIRSSTNAEGDVTWTLFYKKDISSNPIVDANSNQVIPQNSGVIPVGIASSFSQSEKDAFNAGNAIGLTREIVQTAGETTTNFIARVKLDYAAQIGRLESVLRDTYKRAGQSISYP